MRGSRFGFNASCLSPFTRSAISDNSRALSRSPSLFSSVAYVLSPLSLTPQPVFQTGRKPDTTGRLFGVQQDLPQFSGEGTRQRSESAGWASPPIQTLGRVPGWEGGGWARKSVCGAVCYWSCLERLRQWASEPSAESTKTTAEPPRSAASARRAPRWTWSRPSWVPSRACGQYSSS